MLWHLHRAIHEREEAENLVLDKLDLQWNEPDYGINPMAPQNPPPLADDQRPPEMEGKGDPAEEKRKHCFFWLTDREMIIKEQEIYTGKQSTTFFLGQQFTHRACTGN